MKENRQGLRIAPRHPMLHQAIACAFSNNSFIKIIANNLLISRDIIIQKMILHYKNNLININGRVPMSTLVSCKRVVVDVRNGSCLDWFLRICQTQWETGNERPSESYTVAGYLPQLRWRYKRRGRTMNSQSCWVISTFEGNGAGSHCHIDYLYNFISAYRHKTKYMRVARN